MNVEALSTLAAVVLALSLATERGVTSVKTLLPFLDNERERLERLRRLAVQAVALGIAVGLAYLLVDGGALLPGEGGAQIHWLVLGIMASGGSAFWKDLVKILADVRDTRSGLLQDQQRHHREKAVAARYAQSAPAFGTKAG